MKALCLLFALAGPALSFAQVPKTSESTPLLATAAAKGYAFENVDIKMGYEPKFVSEAKITTTFQFTNPTKSRKAIVIADEKDSPKRLENLSNQFNAICKDLVEISPEDFPGSKVEWKDYYYNASNEIKFLACKVSMPSK